MMPPTNPPRWLTALTKTVKEHKDSTSMYLTYLYHTPPANPPAPSAYAVASVSDGVPHVRSQIHRQFLHPASHPSRPLLLTTTDIRTPKVAQILAHPRVEVCWWIEPTQEQFRLAARATLVPAPQHALHAPATAALPALAGGHYAAGEVDWEHERVAAFDAMSGFMKATWLRPPPGSPMPGSGTYDEAKNWPAKIPGRDEAESDEEKAQVQAALDNFALVIFDPYEVDYCELHPKPNNRTRFVLEGEEWKEHIIVP
jgi:pyridoxamine 5'-phosphate oxidase